ncbi:MAG TPA: Slp family lipoprotein [Oleiagrimonas sp.]|nr:Slp family lipoprotein [Oleiagrimonas sp.]
MSKLNTLDFAVLRTRAWKPALVVVGALALGACATVPKPLSGTYTPLLPSQASQGGANGTLVRWGGQLIKTEPKSDKTCFYVLSRPLDATARPEARGNNHGRFVACHQGFYDPEVFTKGREVTFTGRVHGIVSEMVGKYNYAYPRLEARTVYLWPKQPRVVEQRYRASPYGFYNPFWGPIGPWYDPFWYQPRVIYVHRPPQHKGNNGNNK